MLPLAFSLWPQRPASPICQPFKKREVKSCAACIIDRMCPRTHPSIRHQERWSRSHHSPNLCCSENPHPIKPHMLRFYFDIEGSTKALPSPVRKRQALCRWGHRHQDRKLTDAGNPEACLSTSLSFPYIPQAMVLANDKLMATFAT